MAKLPIISSRECIKALSKVGFQVVRQTGSHIILHRADPYAQTVVPYRSEISKGILRSIIRDAGLTVDEFIDLLD
jgi:predicted RNA binding protein YcfA (HicA-like mRNA interferase family)